MKISNNIAFRSSQVQQNLELMASMDDNDIKRASKQLAYQQYRQRESHTQALGVGILLGLPIADSIASAAQNSKHMSSSVKNGLKTFGRYGAYLILGTSFLGLARKITKDSPTLSKFRKEHPGSYIVGTCVGMIASTIAAMAILKQPAKYIINKVDKDAKVRKAIGEQINRLDGGFIHKSLNKTGEILSKEVKSTTVGGILGTGLLLGVLGLFAKQVSNASKVNNDIKQNEQYLKDLRSQSREILTINDESNTTQKLLKLEIEECEPGNAEENTFDAEKTDKSKAEDKQVEAEKLKSDKSEQE